jgi:hypothetical protein
LRIGIDRDELDTLEPLLDHSINGINATAADSDDLDDRQVVLRCCHEEGTFPLVFTSSTIPVANSGRSWHWARETRQRSGIRCQWH